MCGSQNMYVCMYVCSMYVCMYVMYGCMYVSPGEALDGPITVQVGILWRE